MSPALVHVTGKSGIRAGRRMNVFSTGARGVNTFAVNGSRADICLNRWPKDARQPSQEQWTERDIQHTGISGT